MCEVCVEGCSVCGRVLCVRLMNKLCLFSVQS